ncbi:hypothetical protein ACHHYP_08743 [Achlya hypogyna]|uniref:tRNA ligase phosphodiesterase domain-containing protein n=1 Tax=Achlya hypogyna TaxID=1202772 RepID=A0A1V9ZJY3_ACHHY|nr:hypothetical protein ACHHYP_08743 [Achlya hypogyna]
MSKRHQRETKKARSGSLEKQEIAAASKLSQRIFVKLLLDDPKLVAYANELKTTWQGVTAWAEDVDAASTAVVLVEASVFSGIQLEALQSALANYSVPKHCVDASFRLQVENSSNVAGKCLRLTLQLSDGFKVLLSKTGNDLQLKLQSLGIKAQNLWAPSKKLPRDLTLWSLDETTPRKSLHTDIQEINRQRHTDRLKLLTLVVTSDIATLSVFCPPPTPAPSVATGLDTATTALLEAHISFGGSQVVIMRGLPGSGKSTLSRHVLAMAAARGVTTAHCSADMLFETPSGYYHERSKLTEAHDMCKATFAAALAAGTAVVVVDNTHSMLWEYEGYIADATAAGYNVTVLEVPCADACMAQRMLFRNSHGVGADVSLRMFQRWEPHAPSPPTTHVCVPPRFSASDNRRALPLLLHETNDVYIAGVFLLPAAKAALLARFPPKHKNAVAEHMTLAFEPSSEYVDSLPWGARCHLRVISEHSDETGHCVRVEWASPEVPSAGQRVLHITLSFVPEASAVYSNALLARPDATVVDIANEDFIVDGVLGAALRPRAGPRGVKPQFLALPHGVEVARGRQLTLVHVTAGSPINGVVAAVERVAERGNLLVFVGPPALAAALEARQMHFHKAIDATDPWPSAHQVLAAHQDIARVVVLTPDVGAVPSLPLPVAVHRLEATPTWPHLTPQLGRRLYDSEIRSQIHAVWTAITGLNVPLLASATDDRIELPAGGTGDLQRLAVVLERELLMHATDRGDALDVVVSGAYTRALRITVSDSSRSS